MSFGSLLRQTLAIYQMSPVTSGGAETVGGADTTLAADTAAGDLTVTVADDTDIGVDDWLRIGDSGETEVRQVVAVSTGLVTMTLPLDLPHDAGDQVRELDDAGSPTLDAYGQPVSGPELLATVPGLIQARTATEVALLSQAGAVVSTHEGFLYPLDGLTTACWIVESGIRYDITAMPDAAGQDHHLQLALREVR